MIRANISKSTFLMVLLVFTCSVDSLRALSWSPAVTVQCKGLLDLYNESKYWSYLQSAIQLPYSAVIHPFWLFSN